MDITALNPVDLIKWCKERKAALGYTNQKLSEMTGVPAGTIDRVFSGKYAEFKYSTIQPIVSVLLGYREETPEPKVEDEQGQFYYDTIEGYKLVLENKNHEIEELKRAYDALQKEKEYLKAQCADLKDHLKWLEKLVDKLTSVNEQ